jgi:hypothetical protein
MMSASNNTAQIVRRSFFLSRWPQVLGLRAEGHSATRFAVAWNAANWIDGEGLAAVGTDDRSWGACRARLIPRHVVASPADDENNTWPKALATADRGAAPGKTATARPGRPSDGSAAGTLRGFLRAAHDGGDGHSWPQGRRRNAGLRSLTAHEERAKQTASQGASVTAT